jgi:hypothetical protein
MGFVTSALYSQMAVAQQFNAQAALMNNWQAQSNMLNQVGQVALNNTQQLDSPQYQAQLAAWDRATSLQGEQAKVNLAVAEAMKSAAQERLKKDLADYKKSNEGFAS